MVFTCLLFCSERGREGVDQIHIIHSCTVIMIYNNPVLFVAQCGSHGTDGVDQTLIMIGPQDEKT